MPFPRTGCAPSRGFDFNHVGGVEQSFLRERSDPGVGVKAGVAGGEDEDVAEVFEDAGGTGDGDGGELGPGVGIGVV